MTMFDRYLRYFDFRGLCKWLWLSGLVGLIAGAFAILFQFLLQTVAHGCFETLAGISLSGPDHEILWLRVPLARRPIPLLLLLPAVGGLVTGWLVNTFAPEAQGHGTDAAINAYHRRQGLIRARVPIVKLVASVMSIGTGGSGGREGPIAQIGAGAASLIATKLHLSPRHRRLLLAAGLAAGIGSIFRAPLAAAIFAAEVLYSGAEIEAEVILPAMVASIVGYTVFASAHGFEPIFGRAPELGFSNPIELLPYLVLALVVGVVALVFVNTFNGLTSAFTRLRVPPILKLAIGGLLTGAIGLLLLKLTGDGTTLSVMSAGYGALQSLLSSDGLATGAAVLLLIAFGKILTTSLTIGSGGSAGVFGPSMVIGGTLGTAVGQVMHHIAPSLVPHPAAFMIVGMAGFFSAAANTPLSTIFMVSEMTGSYELLIPAMWVCAIAFLAARRWTLYRSQVPSKLDSPAHFGEFAAEILADAPVSEVYKSTRKHAVIPGERKITKVFSEASRTSKRIFPVAGADGNVIGYFRLSDLTGALQNPAKIVQQTLARNLVLPNRQVVKLDDPVEKALDMMAHQHADEVLVTADDGTGRVIGIITSADLMLYYSCRLSQIRSEQAKELEAEGEEEAGPD